MGIEAVWEGRRVMNVGGRWPAHSGYGGSRSGNSGLTGVSEDNVEKS